MTHTLKRPKLIFNIKYVSKINIKIFQKNICISSLNTKILNFKKEVTNIKDETETLKNSLLNIKQDYGYDDFIQIMGQQTLLKKEQSPIYTNINSNSTPKALTVVKTRKAFKYCKYY